MNSDDPLAAARGVISGLIMAVIIFWAPLAAIILWWLTR
jgi:hypothetical protein